MGRVRALPGSEQRANGRGGSRRPPGRGGGRDVEPDRRKGAGEQGPVLGREHGAASEGEDAGSPRTRPLRARVFRAPRNPASPSRANIWATLSPARLSTSWSESRKGSLRLCALSRRPVSLLPAAMSPTRAIPREPPASAAAAPAASAFAVVRAARSSFLCRLDLAEQPRILRPKSPVENPLQGGDGPAYGGFEFSGRFGADCRRGGPPVAAAASKPIAAPSPSETKVSIEEGKRPSMAAAEASIRSSRLMPSNPARGRPPAPPRALRRIRGRRAPRRPGRRCEIRGPPERARDSAQRARPELVAGSYGGTLPQA